MKYYILFNPLAGVGSRQNRLDFLKIEEENEKVFYDVTSDGGYEKLLADLEDGDKIVICGGDGTINRFINGIGDMKIKNDILYFAAGSGNDFMNDMNLKPSAEPIKINEIIENLPIVTIKGKTYRFLNGVGLGVDGFVCAKISRLRKIKNKKVSYIPVALKALFKCYTPTKATVTVDGETATYSRVWMASAMKGRFFGGGMMIAPDQKRMDSEKLITSIVAHNLSKFRILSLFLLIFKGKHTKYTQYVAMKKCHEIKVEFDRPAIIQMDGETIEDVISYTVSAKAKETIST